MAIMPSTVRTMEVALLIWELARYTTAVSSLIPATWTGAGHLLDGRERFL